MKKFKMLTTIASIAMCLAVMVFGVMAANQVTFSITSTISYTVQDVFVDIETRVYSCNKIFESHDELADISMMIRDRCQNGNKADDGALDGDGYYDLSPVGLGEFGDVYKFTSTSPSDTPKPLELDLEYSTEEEIYSYFMVIKVTNLGSIPLYSYVKLDNYEEPGKNNYAYKQDGYIELPGRDDCGYIVFAIGIEDITENVPKSSFNFPIEVAKDLSSMGDINQGTFNMVEDSGTVQNPIGSTFQSSFEMMEEEEYGPLYSIKECSLTNIDTSYEAVKVEINIDSNLPLYNYVDECQMMRVCISSVSAYESFCQFYDDFIANTLTELWYLDGLQNVEEFYGDGAIINGFYDGYNFELSNSIEIPMNQIPENGSLDLIIGLMFDGDHTYSKGEVFYFNDENICNLTITTEYVEDYQEIEYKLSEDGQSYIYGGYKNYCMFPESGAVSILAYYNGLPVVEISSRAFEFAPLTSVDIPEGIETIGRDAFPVALQTISLPSTIKKLEQGALSGIEGEIILPDGIESIGLDSLNWFYSMPSVDYANSIFYFGSQTNDYLVCGITTSRGGTLPSTIKVPSECELICSINLQFGDSTSIILDLSDCENLRFIDSNLGGFISKIILPDNCENFIKEDGVIYNKDKTKIIHCDKDKKGTFVVPESVIEIESLAFAYVDLDIDFSNCSNLEIIGWNAFVGCENIAVIDLSKSSIQFISSDEFYFVDLILPNTIKQVYILGMVENFNSITISKGTQLGEWIRLPGVDGGEAEWYTTSDFQEGTKVDFIPMTEFEEDVTYYCKRLNG